MQHEGACRGEGTTKTRVNIDTIRSHEPITIYALHSIYFYILD